MTRIVLRFRRGRMAKVKRNERVDTIKCKGGMSFNCLTHEHNRGTEYRCRTGRAYMGCNRCAQIPQELVCLRCHDWALDGGEKEHGLMMRKGNPRVTVLLRELTEKMTMKGEV